MPNSTADHGKYIAQLGRAVKLHRNPGEQFCAFAFDLDTQQLEPPVNARARADSLDLNGGAPPPAWLAAFFADTDPDHTERTVLDIFDQWCSYYSSTYGTPERLYIYSFLIPCQRDDHHGHCAGAIASQLLALKQRGIELAIHVGWSNNDVDLDMAGATRDDMWDLHDDGIDITIYKVSAAGRCAHFTEDYGMAYRPDFYTADNIIGYTGDIDNSPTVYFLTDLEYGHITQAHRDTDNVGREEVGLREWVMCRDLNDADFPGYTKISKFRYDFGNRTDPEGARLVEFYRDTSNHNSGIIFHESRSEFVDVHTLNATQTAALAAAIASKQEKKIYQDPSAPQVFPDPTGRYALYFPAGL